MFEVLLIDAGNSRLKWSVSRDGVLDSVATCQWRALDPEVLWGSLARPARVCLASVASPEDLAALHEWVALNWGLVVELVESPVTGHGLTTVYRDPARLGVDRWLAMIAASRACPRGVYVVDCGTATTFDAVAPGGRHLGGLIVPGISVMRDSLVSTTSGIANVGSPCEIPLLGANTADGVFAGTLHATAGFIEYMVERLVRQQGVRWPLMLCGGHAADLLPLLSVPVRHEADLVLQGLNLIAMETE